MEMEDQYGMADLRQYMNGRPHLFTAIPPPPADILAGHHHHNLTPQPPHYDMVMLGREVMPPLGGGGGGGGGLFHDHHFRSPDSTANAASGSGSGTGGGFEIIETGGGGDGGTGRWPRQETLTLLEIRSRLDSKFKEANQKGPLWDEVSRIMCEEHGFQRSGKKCREKFENLYKYYKKTKEGKAGRQDGKHYRFFRQLEALYGETTTNIPTSVTETNQLLGTTSFRYKQPNQEPLIQAPRFCENSLSLSNNSSTFDTSSSEESDSTEKGKKRTGKRSWKVKIKDFIDIQMRKLMEKQEVWLEKMLKTIEHKEEERIFREEEWRKQEAARVEREHKFWASERAWIEARDAALMETLHKLTGNERVTTNSLSLERRKDDGNQEMNNAGKGECWLESETTRLIQLRSSMESSGCSEEVMWEEIASKMACFGYDRSALMCKDKWDGINSNLMKLKPRECSRKRKENLRSTCYFENNESSTCNIQGVVYSQNNGRDDVSPSSSSAAGNAIQDTCFRFFMGEPENLWESYGVKLNKAENN
ncbi:hypothetical protein RJ640_030955 [Escallonia rubra]|uniref:Myb-like domain-containing protein n=1 Tax=Escallonia rubra TaxID=112253 RepID=A0AA88UGD5_9ASTE|nr:hypothetical protein RJ640_030955 [Escallonia rubra]